jgi:hypothetical protein
VYVLTPRRLWRKHPQIREAQILSFSEHEVTEKLFQVTSIFDWSYWTEITKSGDTYVLRSKRGYTVIPLRAFATAEDEERFRELVIAHGRARL